MSGSFVLGASYTYAGVTVALALPADDGAGRPREPDASRFWLRDNMTWRLLDLAALAARFGRPLPFELGSEAFAHAHRDRLTAAARFLSGLDRAPPSALPNAPQPQPDAPASRRWWLD